MNNIETQLERRISYLFEELDNCDVGSERYEAVKKELENLYTIRNQEIKIHAEEAKAYDSNETELMKLEAAKSRDRKDMIFDSAKIAMPLISSAILTNKILKFEQTGVLTSKTWTQCLPRLNFFTK